MSSIKKLFFGNLASKYATYVTHQNFFFVFENLAPNMLLMSSIKFPFLEMQHQSVLLMSSIKIFFF